MEHIQQVLLWFHKVHAACKLLSLSEKRYPKDIVDERGREVGTSGNSLEI